MKIKNVSGAERYFHLEGTKGVRLDAAATSSAFEASDEAVINVLGYVKQGLAQIIEAPAISDIVASVDTPVGISITLADKGEAADAITIAGVTFELYANGGTYTGSDTGVEIGASTATQTATALAAAIDADSTLEALGYRMAGQQAGVVYVVRADGDLSTAITTSESDSGNTFTIAALTGTNASAKGVHVSTHDPGGDTAIVVLTGLKTVDTAVVQARTSGGVVRTGVATIITIDEGTVKVDPDSGTWADDDVVTVIAYGDRY